MKCHVCGGTLQRVVTDLPFKVSQGTIVVIKALPVLQCDHCTECLLEDAVMGQVDKILGRVDGAAELEVVRYAA